MRHSYPCHVSPSALSERAAPQGNGERYRVDSLDFLGTAYCPCCRVPLIARMGRKGPYFHCRCYKGFAEPRP